MNEIIEESLNIIKSYNLNINIDNLKENKSNFFELLFKTLTKKELDLFILQCCLNTKYVSILYNNFNYLCTHTSLDTCDILIKYLINNNVNPNSLLNIFKSNNYSLELYNRLTTYLNKIPSYKLEFTKQNQLLYELKEKINYNDTPISVDSFERLIIIPLSKTEGINYLEFALKKLQINPNKIEYIKNGRGNFSWCFKTDDLVLKLSNSIVTWNIPIFYRINDFIIRKKFNENIITICPYGNVDNVTNQDIHDALNDFKDNNLVLTDNNYQKNFAVVNYEIPNSIFRDVDGIIKYLNINESNSFTKKKVKLIDQDFIYFETDENKKYATGKNFK